MRSDLKTVTILFRAANQLESIIKEDVSLYGLNTTEFGALESLYHKGPLSVQAIRDKVLIADSSMSYVIECLLKKELITKSQDEIDRRVFKIQLTIKGNNLMEEIYPKHRNRLNQILDRLTEQEEENLQVLLKKIGKQEPSNGL